MAYYHPDYVTNILSKLTHCEKYLANILVNKYTNMISYEEYYRYFYNVTICHYDYNIHYALRDVYNSILKKYLSYIKANYIIIDPYRIKMLEDIMLAARKRNNITNHFINELSEYSNIQYVLIYHDYYKYLPLELKKCILEQF